MKYIQFSIIIILVFTQEIKVIKESDKAPNKLKNTSPADCKQNETQSKPKEEDEPGPQEFSLKSGTLYKISESEWYLRAVDSVTKSTFLINLNDINRVKYIEKELEVEKPKEPPEEQKFKEFEWTPLIAFEAYPKNRGGHSMHNIGDYFVLFGGCFLDIKCFDDLFLFNGRTKIWTNPKMFGNPPVGRTGFGSFVNGARLYIFGGHTLKGLMNDLYVFDLESRSWNQLFWPGPVPSPRSNCKMALTGIGGLLFGGYVGETYSNDVFILDLVNERWGKPTPGGEIPIGRESHGMLYHHGAVYVFGGYGTGVVLNDVYSLSEDLTWEKKQVFGKVPSPRQGMALAEYDNRIFIVGGCNPKLGECYNDLYTFDVNTMHMSQISTYLKRNLRAVEYGQMVFQGPLLIHFGGCELMLTCTDSMTALRIADMESCPKCYNGGVCRGGHCSCPQGYQGIDCTVKVICRQNCLNQGFCMSNGYCKCYPGFSGSVCQIMIPCPSNCTDSDHGQCQLDGTCKCEDGFQGDACNGDDKKQDIKVECENNCSGKGECNQDTGLCACEDGFSGPDCSIIDGEQEEGQFKSIWEVLQDDKDDPEKGTTTLRLKEFLANGLKFDQRQEGPTPIFEDDVDKVYYVNEDEKDQDPNHIQEVPSYMDHESDIYYHDEKSQEPHHHKHHTEQTQELQSASPLTGQNLLMVPPKREEKKEEPFELMLLDNCKKRCKEHGVCVEKKCYCWYGYTGEYCQASKIKDFYIGVRRKNVIISCTICFILGLIVGYIIVSQIRSRGASDEFKNIQEVNSGLIVDNEGDIPSQIL